MEHQINIKMEQHYNLDDGCYLVQGSLPAGVFKDNFDELWKLHPVSQAKVKYYDKIVECPRWQQVYMRSYKFSGMNHEAAPLPVLFQPYLEWSNKYLEKHYGDTWPMFNCVLVNWYENGLHYIGKHTDNEPQIIRGSPIISLSLGQERVFRIRDIKTSKVVQDIEMPHNTYLVMGGNIQSQYTHEVPKVSGTKGGTLGRRINITFRCMN